MQENNWNIDTAKADETKVIKLLIYSEKDNMDIVNYLSSISDLTFSTHASEMRFGDTYYFRGSAKNLKVLIVPTINLSVIPRKYRKRNWFYVAINCHQNDHRFDNLGGYITVPADQYNL